MISDQEIAERLAAQRARIHDAAISAGRDPASVRLLAVSKRQPISAIRAAYAAGQRDFGENYVQELVEKAEALSDLPELRFHMIGHLQSNKAKYVARVADCVQTLSSVKLVSELGKRVAGRQTIAAAPNGARAKATEPTATPDPHSALPLDVLVEVNVGGEAAKSGCQPEELGSVLDAVDAQPHLLLRGLMTIPPQTKDPEAARPFFESLAALREHHGGSQRLPELSMGMSADAAVAVACGASWVRIGTAIFGPRPARAT